MFGRESREMGMCMSCVLVPCIFELLNLERRIMKLKNENALEEELVEEENWQVVEVTKAETEKAGKEEDLPVTAANVEDEKAEETTKSEAEKEEEGEDLPGATTKAEDEKAERCEDLPGTAAKDEDEKAGEDLPGAGEGRQVEDLDLPSQEDWQKKVADKAIAEKAKEDEDLVEVDKLAQAEALGEHPDWINNSPESSIPLERLGEGKTGGEKAYYEIYKESSASQYEGPQAEPGEGGAGGTVDQVGLQEGQGTSEGTLTPPEPAPGVELEGKGPLPGALTPQGGEIGGGTVAGKRGGVEEACSLDGGSGGGAGRQVGLLEGQGTIRGTLTPPRACTRSALGG